MESYIGIDLGTSGMKLVLMDETGRILAENTQSYDILVPRDGWTEQRPEDWGAAMRAGLSALLTGQDRGAVRGIACGGQMHGLVLLDGEKRVIRPCILWNDGRTEEQTAYLNQTVGKQRLLENTGNIAFAGFTAPKLLWLREHEPENFARIAGIMLPKDYIVFLLIGAFVTDYSDASGTLLLDVAHKRWSPDMCDLCGVREEQLPALHESTDVVGTVKKEIAEALGLSSDVKVIAGAGDNAASAVGTGTVTEGGCCLSLGTSGTVFLPSDTFSCHNEGVIHSFCHANGRYHLMGCILSAASCRRWWLEEILDAKDYDADSAQAASADTEGLYFLPYLSGERCPHNDVAIRGAFLGLSASVTRAQMSKAVMEGVAFAIRDCLTSAAALGVRPSSSMLCGGGARSETWCQICADMLNIPVHRPETEQGVSFGAAMLAAVGCGRFRTTEEAGRALVHVKKSYYPRSEQAGRYAERYEIYRRLYPALKNISLR